MKFVYPEFLWGFLLLLIPVVIHLFNFKRYKTLYFSSLRFIKHVDQRTKSTQKLRHYLILLSRLLAFSFLILAFAQPYFQDKEGADRSRERVIMLYLDNSFSMEASGPEGQLISEVREKAKEIVSQADLNTLFIIGTNDMSGIEERALNKAEALQRIDQINLSPLSRNVEDIVAWQTEAYKKSFSEFNDTRYILMSDFQKSAIVSKPLSEIDGLQFYPVKFIAEKASNLFIDSVWYSSPVHKENTNAEINIRIQNAGDQNVENLELSVELDDVQKNIFANVEANSNSVTTFTYREKEPGWKKGKITIADDNLYFDDNWYISYEVHNTTKVLIINGEENVNNFAIVYSLDDYYEVSEKDIKGIVLDDFNDKDLIILNGANTISSGLSDYLTKYTTTGGTVALFPGTSADLNSWNSLLSELNLDHIGPVIATGNRIDQLAYEDPFFEGVFERKPDKLNLPSVSKSYQSVQNKGIPLIKLKNGLPLISYSKNAFAFYSSLDERFGNFVNDALFSTLVLRIGELSKRTQPLSLIIGESGKFPVYNVSGSESPLKITNSHVEFIPETNEVGGVSYVSVSQTGTTPLQSGNYSIRQEDKVLAGLSLNYRRDESQLNYLSDSEINVLFNAGLNKVEVNKVGSSHQFSTGDLDKPFSYWKFCIVFTLIFVVTEMLIVRIFK